MQTRIFGKTGLRVSNVGFGGAPVGYLTTGQTQVACILQLLLEQGVNLVNTAGTYPRSEKAIGERRGDFIQVSKCGVPGTPAGNEAGSPDALSQSVDRSHVRLQIDDVMLLHSCDLQTLPRGQARAASREVDSREACAAQF